VIDLSAYLAPLKPRKSFGWREETNAVHHTNRKGK